MPTTTERQQAADALHRAYLLTLIAETEAEMMEDSDSDSSSSSSSSSDDPMVSSLDPSSSSDEEVQPSASEDLLHSLAELYSEFYYNERGSVTKSTINLQLLLHDYKATHPEIFRSYLRISPEWPLSM